ncbi:MAG: pilin [Thiogranum sp.]|nr:pilin [Thiogranum sp.]
MKKMQQGFTLIELMIVVAIIGILAAIAIPAYSDYIARSQATEAVTLMSGAKTPVSEYFADKGSWPTGASFNEVVTQQDGKYVQSMTGAAGGLGFLVTATMRTTDVSSLIQGQSVQLTTANGNRWTCQKGTIDEKYLPAACR